MPTTNRTYRVVTVREMQPGDVIKISRTVVADVEHTDAGVTLTFTNGRRGSFVGSERHGVYRVAA